MFAVSVAELVASTGPRFETFCLIIINFEINYIIPPDGITSHKLKNMHTNLVAPKQLLYKIIIDLQNVDYLVFSFF